MDASSIVRAGGPVVWVVAWVLVQGCGEGSQGDGGTEGSSSADGSGGPCVDEFPAIVTDIDETLTTADEEFSMQIVDGTYDPMMRPASAELMTAYAELGYRILYLTARSEDVVLGGTGENAADATRRWLVEHDFPLQDGQAEIQLAENFSFGEEAREYKAAALMSRQDSGWRFDYAYGNADSDIGAYADAMIGKDVTFIIGELAGEMGTVAVEGEGWEEHLQTFLPMVPAACP